MIARSQSGSMPYQLARVIVPQQIYWASHRGYLMRWSDGKIQRHINAIWETIG